MAKDRIDTLANLDPELLKKGVDLVSIGYVHDVILDETHPKAEGNSAYIGAILYKTRDMIVTEKTQLPAVFPLDRNIKNLPVRNEKVQIHHFGGVMYYTLIENSPNPSVTANETQITSAIGGGSDANQPPLKIDKNVAEHKTPKTNVDISTKLDGYGVYYKGQTGIHNLKMHEGDNLIQSRFGQSIRFSGYNNPTRAFSPTIIIRNKETSLNQQNGENSSVEEDVNRDGSTIAMTSGEYQLPFQPGTLDDKGNSDWSKTAAPLSWVDANNKSTFPSKLIGDQILINSGRIIISSKTAEMIFYSKKDYGFISEGTMHIDNNGGLNVNVGNKINIISNGNDVNFYTENGRINLGNTNLEPLVMGNKLVNILNDLINLIIEQQYLTPSGPSAEGPVNKPQFKSLASKLQTILSGLNKTS
jgi:hypothetical protein